MTDASTEARQVAADERMKARVGGVMSPSGFSWALFEFARNPYFMLIVTYVFPPYFAQYVIGDPVLGQATVAEATKWAGVIGALTAPVLGAMMDRGGRRKPLMAVFLCMLMISGASLWWSLPGMIETGADGARTFTPPTGGLGVVGTMSFLVLGFVGYTYSEMMHNAMLRSSGRPESLSQISGAGIGLGQLSSALCLAALAVIAVGLPALGDASTGYLLQRGTGPFVAIWLIVFVVPFFLFVPDGAPAGGSWSAAARRIFSKNGELNPLGAIVGCYAYIQGLFRTFPEIMKYLLACLIFKDGITALLALGGVYSSGVLGWNIVENVLYGIWASIFGVVGGLWLAGFLDRRLGPRRAIMLQLALLCLAVIIALGTTKESILFGLIPSGHVVHGLGVFDTLSDVFYLSVIAFVAALAAANISASRYMLVTLAPKDRTSEFFGLFALSSTATVWLGPMLAEWATRTFQDQRIGFSPVLVLLGIGLALMFTLKPTTGARSVSAPPASAH
ncbi:MAG: MFS transporter [Hyphomonadaceae bacterium]|nr:MFS transporter [Hyphomonadaceae bacterium]